MADPITSFPKLVLRQDKGSRLDFAELDGNFSKIRSYCQMLGTLFGKLFKPDGSLQPNIVDTDAIQDRAVTQRKLAIDSAFAFEDAGGANASVITLVPPCLALSNGMSFIVKAAATNTGATTLRVDDLAPVDIRKSGSLGLAGGDIQIGAVFQVTYFDGVFQLHSVTNSSTSIVGYRKLDSSLITLPPAVAVPAVAATNTLTWDNSAGPSDGDTVTIGIKVYTFKTTLTPTEGQVLLNGGGDAALLNLIRAINHTGTPGTDYSCAAANTQVSAAASVTAHAFAITALVAGAAGNSIATTKASAHLAWAHATLTGGSDAIPIYITFDHAFGVRPDICNVWMECIADDGDFVISQRLPAINVCDAAFEPAFGITVDAENVTVQRNVVAMYSGGDSMQQLDITTPKWKLFISVSYIQAAAISISTFTTNEYSIGPGQIIDVPHNLGGAPTQLYWVMVCKDASGQYIPDDEIDLVDVLSQDGDQPAFQGGANPTNVFLACAANQVFTIRNKTSGLHFQPDLLRWKVKGYAQR